MEIKDLKRILISFADKPGDIDMDKGHLLLQVRDEVIEASIFLRDARLMIKEGDEVLTAESWIVNRVARLPLLAERILSYVPPEMNFVVPAATLVDQLEVAPEEGEV